MVVDVRKGMPSVQLDRAEFEKRFREQFFDPAFGKVESEIAKIAEIAWHAYDSYNKNPRKQKAGKEFSDPDFELPVEWLAARAAIIEAQKRQTDPKSPSRILIVNGSTRSDQTCPGEISKTWRLAQMCRELVEQEKGFEVEVLDLSLLASEGQKRIYPCKACLSTAQPLCHWPCSCYPNFALGQVGDWMAEIYPKWVAAHGIMIVTPVNWYQAPSSLKLMIDRLVCADGGNADPTTTQLKNPSLAKELELKGWPYPRHLAGRAFSVVVHGDASGTENLRRILCDWLEDMGLIPCGHKSQIDRYVGYYGLYATSHKDLDEAEDFQEEVKNAARALIEGVKLLKKGELKQPDAHLREARPK
jgi:multimeric flavodoxin WrbA